MKVFPAKFWVLKEKSFALIFVCRKATVTKRERERERDGVLCLNLKMRARRRDSYLL